MGRMPIKDVQDLRVYQLSMKLLEPVYRYAALVQLSDQLLATNLRKTAKQIAPAIAEGYAKKSSPKEFKRFLLMALGSSDEMITHLRQTKMIALKAKPETADSLIAHYKSLSKQINSLLKIWQ